MIVAGSRAAAEDSLVDADVDSGADAALVEQPARASAEMLRTAMGRAVRTVVMMSYLVQRVMGEVKSGDGESRLTLVVVIPPGVRCMRENIAESWPLTRSGPASMTWW